MTKQLFADRAAAANLDVSAVVIDRLLAYFGLLEHWNRTINLASLRDPAAAIDRLLVEPLVAAQWLPRGGTLLDVGSGGGSPAIPLAISLGVSSVTMIESRSRKGAFLREAIRELGLLGTVEVCRFQEFARRPAAAAAFSLVSIRAVRTDAILFKAIEAAIAPKGMCAAFMGGVDGVEFPATLALCQIHPLLRGDQLMLLKPAE